MSRKRRVDIRTFVGAELRRLRLRAGLAQDDVATALGSHRPIISRNERGLHAMALEHIDRQARACGGSLAHVLYAYDVATGALRPMAGPRAAHDND